MMVTKKYVLPAAIAIAAIVTLLYAQGEKAGTLVTPKEAYEMLQKDTSAVVLDVRTSDEYYSETGHLPRAILIPVQALEDRIGALDQYKHRKVVVYCRTGHRSANAAAILQKNGFTVFDVDGGITRWNEEKLPVVHDKR